MAGGHPPIWRHLVGLMAERDLSGKTVLDFGCNQGRLLRLPVSMSDSLSRARQLFPCRLGQEPAAAAGEGLGGADPGA